MSATGCFKGFTNSISRFLSVTSVKTIDRAVNHPSVISFGFFEFAIMLCTFLHHQYSADGDVVLGCKFKVTLVVSRDGHHCSSSVTCDNEIANPNRNSFVGKRVICIASRKHTFLLLHVLDAVKFSHNGYFVVQVLPFCFAVGPLDNCFSQRVFRC